MISDHFPPLGVGLSTPRLRLRMPTDADLSALADAALRGVHDPETMPFRHPWTDQGPERLGRAVIQHNWSTMAAWTPEQWAFNAVVIFEGRVIGLQEMNAKDFAVTRQVGSGSWLTREYQGMGLGTEMRAAILHLAFEGLGALEAVTEAFDTSTASIGVSRRLGYRPNGIDHLAVRGRRVRELRYRLTRRDWEEHRTVPVEIEGLEPALPYFGVGELPE